jgi:hypothetical protein
MNFRQWLERTVVPSDIDDLIVKLYNDPRTKERAISKYSGVTRYIADQLGVHFRSVKIRMDRLGLPEQISQSDILKARHQSVAFRANWRQAKRLQSFTSPAQSSVLSKFDELLKNNGYQNFDYFNKTAGGHRYHKLDDGSGRYVWIEFDDDGRWKQWVGARESVKILGSGFGFDSLQSWLVHGVYKRGPTAYMTRSLQRDILHSRGERLPF